VAIFLPFPDPKFPWEAAYQDAVLETDNLVLADRIQEAEEVITKRLRNLPKLQENEEERELAERVLENLAVLRQERLMPPARRA
jgi:hypothetical protein